MSTSKSVLGVLGMCGVGYDYSTQFKAPKSVRCSAVCWVCWVWRRVRACVTTNAPISMRCFYSYARANKPNQPNTPNTNIINALILKGCRCVGFVLGMGICVLGSIVGGRGR